MASARPELVRADPPTSVENEIRNLVRGIKQDDAPPAELSSEVLILKMAASSIAEIDKLMEELQAARNYLHAEGERVRRMAARYAHLTQTATTSVRIISERMKEWRIGEPPGAPDAARAHAGSPAEHDGERPPPGDAGSAEAG